MAKLPMEPKIAALCDEGRIEEIDGEWLDHMAGHLEYLDQNQKEEQ